ncbi:unnamed protein product [Moneuplotes crassus]|uniref:Phosphatidate cytidylyltransferase n=1 Tax=Euplotes crassus TaxID=5936 RepID=A0AAD1XJ39_EUPCR|nr:unnamed protein product [Moneuplotes crassus]
MNNYLRRWATAFVLLGTIGVGLQYPLSSIILAQIVMHLGIFEYRQIAKNIVTPAIPSVVELRKSVFNKTKKEAGVNVEYILEYNIHFQCGWLLATIYFFLGEHERPLIILYPLFILSILFTFILKIFSMTSMAGDIRDRKDTKWNLLVQATLFEICLEVIGITLFGLCFCFYGILYYKYPVLIFIGLCLVFQTDHGALIFGSKFGRTPINGFYYNKTVEGCLGGIFFCILNGLMMKIEADYLTKFIYPSYLSFQDYLCLGLGVGILSILGDLLESFLKRCAGVKDSGKLLPGHGGIFDRIDSVLMAAPFLLYYFEIYSEILNEQLAGVE